jgi:sugar/nucleoside kinase (ribokinase family)
MKISGIGCTLIDYLYNWISFNSPELEPYISLNEGDGGISPGKLVFTGELEDFANEPYDTIIERITGGRKPDAKNIGGPAVVSMIHLAQLLEGRAEIRFTGAIGKDEAGRDMLDFLQKTPLSSDYLQFFNEPTPFTHVLSDPDYNDGNGERTFINNIGAAYHLKDPGHEFFDADICVFGGTALVPAIHDKLGFLLRKAKERNAITVVNTVYDFRNQKKNPDRRWPLGSSDESYKLTDLLIMDLEESLKLSGEDSGDAALDFFISKGVKGVVITEGAEEIRVFSSRDVYKDDLKTKFSVSGKVSSDLKCSGVKGDTTGCGDNFVGGMIYSLAEQLLDGIKKPDIREMIRWGRASGGYACFYLGGTYFESESGEKKSKVVRYLE